MRILNDAESNGEKTITSSKLAELSDITSSLVRQDLNAFGSFGHQGYGYDVAELKKIISDILLSADSEPIILVGTGNIGHALLNNFDFSKCGFDLVAAFDRIQEHPCDTAANEMRVLPMSKLKETIEHFGVRAAVLSVSQDAAQQTARELADLGITAIWNFTNVGLRLQDDGVTVESIHFADSLQTLKYYMSG